MAFAQTICRLIYGGQIFDLNDKLRFILADNFTPPAADTSLNITGSIGGAGGRLVEAQARDRQWSFSVIAVGSNYTETDGAVRALQQFLHLATGGVTKMYLEYCHTAHIPYRPTYGQAGWSRYEVKFGQVHMRYYGTSAAKTNIVNVGLLIGPYKLGLEQQAMMASGGVWEYNLFNSGIRGIQLLPNSSNLFTNPIFGYSDTSGSYTQGWMIGSDLSYRQADEENTYHLWGKTMLEVQRTGNINFLVTQSVTLTNFFGYNLQCYAKRKDGAALTSTDMQLYYNGAAVTTTFKALKDGWYRLSALVTGVIASPTIGVQIKKLWTSYYLTGFVFTLFAEVANPVPFFYGDMPGYMWNGVPHNSKTDSAGTSGYLRLPHDAVFGGVNKADQGTVRTAFIWGQDVNFAASGRSQTIIGGNPSLYIDTTDSKLTFYDSTTTTKAASVATYAEGDLWVVHITFGPNGAKIFVNGVLIISVGTYTATVTPFDFLLGSDLGYNGSIWLDLTVWRDIATDVHIQADYTEVYEALTAGDSLGQRLSAIPYVQRLNPTTGTFRLSNYSNNNFDQDFHTIAGIEGDAPALTKLEYSMSVPGSSIVLAKNSFNRVAQVYPLALFKGANGTAWTGAHGGQVTQKTVDTTDVSYKDTTNIFVDINGDLEAYRGREFYIVASIADAGANLVAKAVIDTGGGLKVESDYVPISATTTLKKFLIGPVVMPEVVTLEKHPVNFDVYLVVKRTVAGSATVSLDWMRVIFDDVAVITVTGGTTAVITYDSENFSTGFSNANALTEKPIYKGRIIELDPNSYNFLYSTHGAPNTNTDITGYMILTTCKITPRWSLL